MTLRGWVLLFLFVLGFLWLSMQYPELIRRYYCPIAGLLVICGGIYSSWTGRLVDEFGYQIRGRWVRILGIFGIALGLWMLYYCPEIAARSERQSHRIPLNGATQDFGQRFIRAESQACALLCIGRQLFRSGAQKGIIL